MNAVNCAMGSGRTILLRNAKLVATMDDVRREIAGGGVFIRGHAVAAVGLPAELPATADEVIDCRGKVILPGLVNTHHHFFQTLTRAVPAAQDADLFNWLRALYPLWARITPDMLNVSATVAMAELMLSGCTTASDHLYLFPNGSRLDDTIDAAHAIGLRFHACRGAMSVGESLGGLPPDALVEDEGAILYDTQRVIETHHDRRRFSMLRIAAAPCSPFSVSRELMRETAALARTHGVGLHTHLAENDDDVAWSREKFGCTPPEYAEDLGFTGPHAWHAHCVKLDARGIELFARTGTGVAHCPTSNMRLGSGIAPVRAMLDAGMHVGLGVDGSASNDSSHLLAETRQALLLQRVGFGVDALTAREALELATRGGAKVLGRDDIGHLAPGMAADVVAFDTGDVGLSGSDHDPLAALVFCAPARADLSIINGRVVIRDGKLATIDLPPILERHRSFARSIVRGD
jgi:cytosine/adenosine deaminase-related metal-dependent hydrolase